MVVGAPQTGGFRNGYARVLSGKDGAVLHTVSSRGFLSQMGRAVSGAGDVNRDGHADVVVGEPCYTFADGAIHVVSGKDGAVLFSAYGPLNRYEALGWPVAAAGDVDGWPDVAAGGPEYDRVSVVGHGLVRVFSGRKASTIFTVRNRVRGGMFGAAVGGAGDVNGDGRPDVIVGAPLADDTAPDGGIARGLSGRALTLFADTHQLSVASAETRRFFLHAGTQRAGQVYLLGGSLSGTSPGFPLGPFRLPLNPDAYFLYTVLAPNAPPLSDSFGVLDDAGMAGAGFTVIPALFAPLVGITVHHACVVVGQTVAMVSDPTPLTFRKREDGARLRTA